VLPAMTWQERPMPTTRPCALFPDFGAAHYAFALLHRALGQVGQAEEQLRLYEEK